MQVVSFKYFDRVPKDIGTLLAGGTGLEQIRTIGPSQSMGGFYGESVFLRVTLQNVICLPGGKAFPIPCEDPFMESSYSVKMVI